MKQAGKITVALPVYNGELYLKTALDGILSQTLGDFTLLISDNASTDSTQDICEEYQRLDSRVHYLRQKTNRGAAWNFNTLANRATTSLFMWHAADDIAHPQLLERCKEKIDTTDAILAYTAAGLIDQQGNIIASTPEPRDTESLMVTRRFAACLNPIHYTENLFYGLIRTEILQKTRLHGVFGGGDRALCAELSLYGPFIRIPEVLFHRRLVKNNTTEAEIQFYNSGQNNTFNFREWRILWHNLGSIIHAPLKKSEQLKLYSLLLKRLVHQRDLYIQELKDLVKIAIGRKP